MVGFEFKVNLFVQVSDSLMRFHFSVKQSKEPGWLEGTYNGVFGLIPENYVEILEY